MLRKQLEVAQAVANASDEVAAEARQVVHPSLQIVVIRLLFCLLGFLLLTFLSYIFVWFMFKTDVNKSIGMTKSWSSQECVMAVGEYVRSSLNWARMQCVHRTPCWIYFLRIVRDHIYPLNCSTELLSICYLWWMEFAVIHIVQMWFSSFRCFWWVWKQVV
jgi:hypothetical protein